MDENLKQLLLQDLCARLPYGVIVNVNGNNEKVDEINPFEGIITCGFQSFDVKECKPYLRSMLSMTEEEREIYYNLCYEEEREEFKFGEWAARIHYHDTIDSIDYLNSIHIDYRDLIPKNLAIEVTEENNPYEN